MQLTFEAVSEARPGPKWQALFQRYWPSYNAWYESRSGPQQPSAAQARAALRRHMPELMPTFERLITLTGDNPQVVRLLSCFRPPAYLISCSQAALSRPGARLLVRNYDLDPALNEGLILHTAWTGRRVIATSEFLWGVADGMNDAGLALSLAFGGRTVVGDGFGVPLILRYVLEICDDLNDAIEVLRRVPSHMAYNVTLLDKRGDAATVQVAPDQSAVVLRTPIATNHQGKVEWAEHARFTATVEREDLLRSRHADPKTTGESLVKAFLEPPLYNSDYRNGFGTLYTAAFQPNDGIVRWHWPNAVWEQSFADFREARRVVNYTAKGAHVAVAGRESQPPQSRRSACPPAQSYHWPTTGHGAAPVSMALQGMRVALTAAGCTLSPALKAWFDSAEHAGQISWETLGEVLAQPACGH
jgi:predicted choloylglycine hydrolase